MGRHFRTLAGHKTRDDYIFIYVSCNNLKLLLYLARPTRFELVTSAFGGQAVARQLGWPHAPTLSRRTRLHDRLRKNPQTEHGVAHHEHNNRDLTAHSHARRTEDGQRF